MEEEWEEWRECEGERVAHAKTEQNSRKGVMINEDNDENEECPWPFSWPDKLPVQKETEWSEVA